MTTTYPGAIDVFTTKVDGAGNFIMAAHVNDLQDAMVAAQTLLHDAFPLVKNTSGNTAAVGDVGYIDSAGEYKTTTSAGLVASWCVVKVGGANNADIRVAVFGRHTVPYAGSAPAAGNFLGTSTTAAKVVVQASLSPATIGVAAAAGSGGTVAMLMFRPGVTGQVQAYQLVASDGSPDPAWSVDASGNLDNPGGGIMTAPAAEVIVKVRNASGATASAGALGYVDELGQFKTTTAAGLLASWAVVVVGGANNTDIYVGVRGRFPITYTGTTPVAGNYLTTSTVAGSALAQSYVSPAIVGVVPPGVTASGGTIETLLLPNRTQFQASNSNQVLQIAASSDSQFSSTINGTPGATLVYNAPTGNENSISPAAAGELAALVLWNTSKTPDEFALIQATNTGTNVITPVTAITGWSNGESIQVDSPTVTGTIGGATMFDVQIKDTSIIPALAVALIVEATCNDTGGPAQVFLHPYEAGAASSTKAQTVTSQVASVSSRDYKPLPLTQRRFCIGLDATGAGTLTIVLRLLGYVVAAP